MRGLPGKHRSGRYRRWEQKRFLGRHQVIGSCGSGMKLGYTTEFNTGLSEYVLRGIELSNIPTSCRGKSVSLTLYHTAGNAVGSVVNVTLPTSGTTRNASITANSNAIAASRVAGVSAVVR